MHRDRDSRDLDDDYFNSHDSRPRTNDYPLDERDRPPPQIIDRRREVCKNFLLGRCKKGNGCPYTHSSYIPESEKKEICRDFQRGQCSRGERSCPFLHILVENPQQWAHAGRDNAVPLGSPRRGSYGPPPPPAAAAASSRGASGHSADSSKNGRSGPEVCRDFLYRKNCSRGKNCPYLHVSLDDKDSEPSNKKRRSELTKEQEELQRENRSLREENNQIENENNALKRENEDFREENIRLRRYLEEITGRPDEIAV